MKGISKKNKIIASILAVIIGFCGYNIVHTKMSGQITFNGGEVVKDYKVDFVVEDEEQNQKKKEEKEIVVHIIGQVKNPGLVKIPENSRISDAIEAAGGVLEDADLEVVNLAYRLQDGKQVYIPSKNERQESDAISGVQGNTSPSRKIVSGTPGLTKSEDLSYENIIVNINTAGTNELEKLPGIGPATAEAIIKYRKINGVFKCSEDIMKVSGIGEAKYEQLKDKITI